MANQLIMARLPSSRTQFHLYAFNEGLGFICFHRRLYENAGSLS